MKVHKHISDEKIHPYPITQLTVLNKVANYSPGLILTVDEGRCEEEPGEKEESTAEEELRE